jgi:hypothetical protein
MKNIISVFVVILVLTSCVKHSSPPHSLAGDKLIFSFEKVALEEYRLRIWGEGGGFMDAVNSFSFHFVSNEMMDVDQARRFYLSVLDRLLEMINTDEELRPYLKHYPFTRNDIKLDISFFVNWIIGNRPPQPYITYISKSDRFIYFRTRGNDSNSLEGLPPEPFERARSIVKYQDFL